MVEILFRLEVGGRRLGQVDLKENHRYSRVRFKSSKVVSELIELALELGINFLHIRAKSLTVLNPLQRIDEHIMDDADLAGPLLFCFCFGTFLLFVSNNSPHKRTRNSDIVQSGKPQFGYIYGVGVLGSASIYTLLNLMSEKGIDAYRVASVLGYCLLPMVGVGAISVMVTLE